MKHSLLLSVIPMSIHKHIKNCCSIYLFLFLNKHFLLYVTFHIFIIFILIFLIHDRLPEILFQQLCHWFCCIDRCKVFKSYLVLLSQGHMCDSSLSYSVICKCNKRGGQNQRNPQNVLGVFMLHKRGVTEGANFIF